MSFPTVKTDPYKAGLQRSRRCHLWTEKQWGRLVDQAKADHLTFDQNEYPISEACIALIMEFNLSERQQ